MILVKVISRKYDCLLTCFRDSVRNFLLRQ